MAATDSALQRLGIDAFRAAVDPSYQTGSKLRALVTEEPDVMAQSYRWSVAGTTDTRSRGLGAGDRAGRRRVGDADRVPGVDGVVQLQRYPGPRDHQRTLDGAGKGRCAGRRSGAKHDGLIIGGAGPVGPERVHPAGSRRSEHDPRDRHHREDRLRGHGRGRLAADGQRRGRRRRGRLHLRLPGSPVRQPDPGRQARVDGLPGAGAGHGQRHPYRNLPHHLRLPGHLHRPEGPPHEPRTSRRQPVVLLRRRAP